MKLSEYQTAAAATADPKAYSLSYLIPMIVGETGELFGQKAKSFWHGWSADKLQQELVSEFGDICWGIAILLKSGNVSNVPSYVFPDSNDGWHWLLSCSHDIHLFYTRPGYQSNRMDWILQEAAMMWATLEHHCEEITGVAFDTVLIKNLQKLADRAARGVLKGQGDHR